jgi:electron transfer flavoprotein alpha subunit
MQDICACSPQGDFSVESASGTVDPDISSFVGEELSKSQRPELTSAEIIISGGRAMQLRENFTEYIEQSPTSSAPLWAPRAPRSMPVMRQTTGRWDRPVRWSRRSSTVGISGAIRHLAGMKDSKVIVAINKDEVPDRRLRSSCGPL